MMLEPHMTAGSPVAADSKEISSTLSARLWSSTREMNASTSSGVG
jgi:hypothetical protein